jgi:hypothetical protein
LSAWRGFAAVVLRLAAAAILAVAGISKLGIDGRLALHNAIYDVWPVLGGRLSWSLAGALPWVELAVATGLLLPWRRAWRSAALAGALLSCVFLAWIASAAAIGFDGSCACFGSGGEHPAYPLLAGRALALLAVLLAAWRLGRPDPA